MTPIRDHDQEAEVEYTIYRLSAEIDHLMESRNFRHLKRMASHLEDELDRLQKLIERVKT